MATAASPNQKFAFMRRVMPKHVYMGDGNPYAVVGDDPDVDNVIVAAELDVDADASPRKGMRFLQRDRRPLVPMNAVFRWIMIGIWVSAVLFVFVAAGVFAGFRTRLNIPVSILIELGRPWVVTALAIVKEFIGALFILAVWVRPDLLWLSSVLYAAYVVAAAVFGILLAIAIPSWYTATSLGITTAGAFVVFVAAGVVGWLGGNFLGRLGGRMARYRQWIDSTKTALVLIIGVLSLVLLLQGIVGGEVHKSVALGMMLIAMVVVFFLRSLQTHLAPAKQWTIQSLQWRLFELTSLTTNFHFSFVAFGLTLGVVQYNPAAAGLGAVTTSAEYADGDGGGQTVQSAAADSEVDVELDAMAIAVQSEVPTLPTTLPTTLTLTTRHAPKPIIKSTPKVTPHRAHKKTRTRVAKGVRFDGNA